jgi:uncharacterized membrane protein YeaQ/YmgE (transglycosylase-associated protein family)
MMASPTSGAIAASGGRAGHDDSVLLLGILVWGLFAGWLAHLILYRGTDPEWGRLLVAGLAGSFVGGLLASLIAGDGIDLRPSGLIGTVVGAIVVLLIDKAVRGSAA